LTHKVVSVLVIVYAKKTLNVSGQRTHDLTYPDDSKS